MEVIHQIETRVGLTINRKMWDYFRREGIIPDGEARRPPTHKQGGLHRYYSDLQLEQIVAYFDAAVNHLR
jgi:hypothetical protein